MGISTTVTLANERRYRVSYARFGGWNVIELKPNGYTRRLKSTNGLWHSAVATAQVKLGIK